MKTDGAETAKYGVWKVLSAAEISRDTPPTAPLGVQSWGRTGAADGAGTEPVQGCSLGVALVTTVTQG
jgi:hypothetical protein